MHPLLVVVEWISPIFAVARVKQEYHCLNHQHHLLRTAVPRMIEMELFPLLAPPELEALRDSPAWKLGRSNWRRRRRLFMTTVIRGSGSRESGQYWVAS